MVSLIVLRKGFHYPPEFRERVRQFNNSLVNDNARFIADLIKSTPGMRLHHFDVDGPAASESEQHDALKAERDALHQQSLGLAA
ncbi:hypothetical protein [Noviherbaspirillum pedocola]|uniref:Uncharacterized protein n=1 Tax=Noviherbaspirillum pedocola TaxID=2801341 RepID=A0A934T071_9BURK|nr:hypothetical protein [Noviherbaspirillum pedocola]MBK4736034.1 hypothetical protein [Noviherbaspirillum pedocola]